MKPEFPKKIKILDQIFKIIYVEKLSEMDDSGIKTFYGQTDFHSRIIRVFKPKEYSTSEVWNTIIHESIHVIFETLKISECEENTKDEEFKEKVIHLLATGINTMMIDNGFCFKDITD